VIAALLVSRIAIGTAVVGTLALGAAILVPPATPPARVWFDQPLDGSVLAAGEHTIRVHLRDDAPLLRLVITRDGQQVGAPGDDTLDRVVDAPARAAWMGEFTWDFEPGTYVLQPLLGADDDDHSPVTVIVVGDLGDPGAAPTPEPSPTPTPTVTPSPTPSATASAAPSTAPSATPSSSPSAAPSASPSPSPSPSIPPVLTGSVSRVAGIDDWNSTFTGSGISPAGAIVNVQVNVRNNDTGTFGGWSSTPCVTSGSATAPFTCTVSNHTIPAWGRQGSYYPSYLVVYRLEVVFQGRTYYGPGGNWTTALRVG
jgi:hypothetical protein